MIRSSRFYWLDTCTYNLKKGWWRLCETEGDRETKQDSHGVFESLKRIIKQSGQRRLLFCSKSRGPGRPGRHQHSVSRSVSGSVSLALEVVRKRPESRVSHTYGRTAFVLFFKNDLKKRFFCSPPSSDMSFQFLNSEYADSFHGWTLLFVI